MGGMKPLILIVEDSASQRYLLAKLLTFRLGYEVLEAENGVDALQKIADDKEQKIAAVLLDLEMPEMDGREALPKIHALRPTLPVIVLTATESITDVVDVMKLGAADFLIKPPDIDLVKASLAKAIKIQTLELEVDRLTRERDGKHAFTDIIGYDGDLKKVTKLARRAAASDISILMSGESGVGKEVFARAIHSESARKNKPFVAVNCGALPRELVESILFGHKKGAFTGAIADAMGKFREAEGGTLFLDEVGELPLDAQVKLLRVLQQREVEPVGGGKPVPVNIRIIAASNRSMAQEVKRGQFREDLYYRLNAFPIHIPPLRDRKHDIFDLALFFLHHYALTEKRTMYGFEKKAEQWLHAHTWPGNVRELENKIYRAVLLCEGSEVTLEHLLYDEMQPAHDVQKSPVNAAETIMLHNVSGGFKTMDMIEREAIRAAIAVHDNNIRAAADALQIGVSTIYRKLSDKV